MRGLSTTRLLLSKLLLAGGGLGLLIVAIVHIAGYLPTVFAVANSGLRPELQATFKALYLGHALQAFITALVILIGAFRPQAISAAVLLICALIPSLTAAVMFHFLGSFWGPVVLAVSGLLVILGAAARPPIMVEALPAAPVATKQPPDETPPPSLPPPSPSVPSAP